jgi:hypothetical protein
MATKLLTATEAAAMLDLHVVTVNRVARTRRIPSFMATE